jgi:hypothetical protein
MSWGRFFRRVWRWRYSQRRSAQQNGEHPFGIGATMIFARRFQRHISFEGTFRLSIIAAAAAAAYTGYASWQANVRAYNDTCRWFLRMSAGANNQMIL